MENSNLKECSEFVSEELKKKIGNDNAIGLLGLYITRAINNHSNIAKVTNEQIRNEFKWQNNQVLRANAKLENMKLISRNVSSTRNVPTEVTLLFDYNSQVPTVENISTEIEDKETYNSIFNEINSLKETIELYKIELESLKEENEKLKEGVRIVNNKLNVLKQENYNLKEAKSNTVAENTFESARNTPRIKDIIEDDKSITEDESEPSESLNLIEGDKEALDWYNLYANCLNNINSELFQMSRVNIEKYINETINDESLNFDITVKNVIAFRVAVYQYKLEEGHFVSNPCDLVEFANRKVGKNYYNILNIDGNIKYYMTLYNKTKDKHNVVIPTNKEVYDENSALDNIISKAFN